MVLGLRAWAWRATSDGQGEGAGSPLPRHSQAAQAQVALQQLSVPENTGCSPFLSSFREHRLTW